MKHLISSLDSWIRSRGSAVCYSAVRWERRSAEPHSSTSRWSTFGLAGSHCGMRLTMSHTSCSTWKLSCAAAAGELASELKVLEVLDPNFLRNVENAIQFGSSVLVQGVGDELPVVLEPVLSKKASQNKVIDFNVFQRFPQQIILTPMLAAQSTAVAEADFIDPAKQMRDTHVFARTCEVR